MSLLSIRTFLCLLVLSSVGGLVAQEFVRTHSECLGGSGVSDFGRKVAALGDLDSDGLGDYAVADYTYHLAPTGFGTMGSGRVYVYSGATGNTLQIIDPPSDAFDFAAEIGAVGDVNGDGRIDLAIRTHNGILVYDALSGSIVQIIACDTDPNQVHHLGPCVGDLDGDGRDDFAYRSDIIENTVGTPPIAVYDTVHVVGGNGQLLMTIQDPSGSGRGSTFGFSIAALGDVSGDLIPDFAVSRPGLGLGSTSAFHPGTVWVVSGASTGTAVSFLWSFSGPGINSYFGSSIAAIPDVDGDAIDDLAVLAPLANGTTYLTSSPNPLGAYGELTLHSGVSGAALASRYFSSAELPFSLPSLPISLAQLVSAGDMNGDGRGDVAMSLLTANRHVQVFSGTDLSLMRDLAPAAGASSFLGQMANVGDIDGDHRADLLIAGADAVALYSLETIGVSYFGQNGPYLGSTPIVGTHGSLAPGGTFSVNLSNVIGNVDVTLWGGFSTTHWAPYILPLDLGASHLNLNAVGNSIYISLDSFASTYTMPFGSRAAATLDFNVQTMPVLSGFHYFLQWVVHLPYGPNAQRVQTSQGIAIVLQ